jgi:beta-fructofuranosidase
MGKSLLHILTIKWFYMIGLLFCGYAELRAQEQKDNTSKVPKYSFANTLGEQEAQLEKHPMIERFAKSREKLSSDPYRPIFHYVNPEGNLNDPNGLCFWQGQWHLFYQAYPPEDKRQHWGHAVSKDLTHWRDLPLAIYPNPEKACFSGAAFVEKERVIAMYHGLDVGNMIATSEDPLLLNWKKINGGQPVIPIVDKVNNQFPDGKKYPYRVFDPCIWKKDGYYISLSGGNLPNELSGLRRFTDFLFKSKDLVNWEYLHPFVENDIFTLPGDDGACPYFWPIGNKHILLFFSHMSGGQYLLGNYDTKNDKFNATSHGKFNHGGVTPGGVHAPSAFPDGKGGVITLFNINQAKNSIGWNRLMTLPIRLTLEGENQLNMEPAINSELLRYGHQHLDEFTLEANKEMVLERIEGNSMEILVEADAKNTSSFEINVLRSPDKQEYTRIAFYKERGLRTLQKSSVITLDNTNSSILPDVKSRPEELAPVVIGKNEPLKLRIFIDKSVVEVFVNGRQYLCERVYPGLEASKGISFLARGSGAVVKSFDAWQMKSIWE